MPPRVKTSEYQRAVWSDKRLNPTRKLILAYLSNRSVWDEDSHGYMTASHRCIADATGIAARETVSRNAKWLVEHGYLKRQQPMGNGRYLVGKYRLSMDAFSVTQSHGQAVENPAGQDRESVTQSHRKRDSEAQQRRSSLPSVGDAVSLPAAGVGNAIEGQNQDRESVTVVPAPPGPARPMAEPPDAFDAEHADMDAERLDGQIAELAGDALTAAEQTAMLDGLWPNRPKRGTWADMRAKRRNSQALDALLSRDAAG